MYSLVAFKEIIFDVLELTGVNIVAEVGVGEGLFSRALCKWSEGRDVRLHLIDRQIPSEFREHVALYGPRVRLHAGHSLSVLGNILPCDAVILDGDHNYYTVHRELLAVIEASASQSCIIFVHDVGWPCGRRDFYFAPEDIPEVALHPFVNVPFPDESSCFHHVWNAAQRSIGMASHGGGKRNGVLTAIEDVMEAYSGWSLRIVPCVYGLGIMYKARSEHSSELDRYFRPLHNNLLLSRLERERVRALMRAQNLPAPVENVVVPDENFYWSDEREDL